MQQGIGEILTSNIFSNGAARRIELLVDVQRRLSSTTESLEQVKAENDRSTKPNLTQFHCPITGSQLCHYDAALRLPSRRRRHGAYGVPTLPGSRCEWTERVGRHPAPLTLPVSSLKPPTAFSANINPTGCLLILRIQ